MGRQPQRGADRFALDCDGRTDLVTEGFAHDDCHAPDGLQVTIEALIDSPDGTLDGGGQVDSGCAASDVLCFTRLSPLAACRRGRELEVLDGFKRQAAARQAGLETLSVRVLEVDERTAKAAILGLNRGHRASVPCHA